MQNYKSKFKKFYIILFLLGLFFWTSLILLFFNIQRIEASTFFFQPSNGSLEVADTFFLEVRLDTEGEEINAAEAHIVFSNDVFEVVDVDYGGSFLTLWPQSPSFSNGKGTVDFAAGTPQGFNGKDGVIGRILFRTKTTKKMAVISFKDVRALLNDGKGTPTTVSFSKAVFDIQETSKEKIPGFFSPSHLDQLKWYSDSTLVLHWDVEGDMNYSYLLSRDRFDEPDDIPDTPVGDIKYENLKDGVYYFHLRGIPQNNAEQNAELRERWMTMIDATPPQEFEVRFVKEKEESGNKAFLSFSAEDLTSGLDRYELCYINVSWVGKVKAKDCRGVVSPTILTQEDLKQDRIAIRAYDKAGNFLASQVNLSKAWGRYCLLAIGGLLVIIIIFWQILRISRVRAFFRILFKGRVNHETPTQ